MLVRMQKARRHTYTALLVIAGLASTTQAQAEGGRSDLDHRREWLQQRTILQRQEVAHCSLLREQGVAFGRETYQRVAPDCASLYLRAGYMAAALEEVRVIFPLPEQGFNQACYQSGWIQGYLEVHNELYPLCEAQLSSAARERLQRRIAACAVLGDKIKHDSTTFGEFYKQHSTDDARDEAADLYRKMSSLVRIGQTGQAWDLMLSSQRDEMFSSLPCSIAIVMKLSE